MSHIKQIKRNKELQAKFALAVNNTSSLVSSWLKPTNITETIDTNVSSPDFLNLPIITGSSGLSLSSINHDPSDINTIGDYLKTGKSLKTLSKKKNSTMINGKIKSSKALNALQNKLKKQEKVKREKRDTIAMVLNKPIVMREDINNNSDSEGEMIQKSVPKKSLELLIDSKIRKKKKKL